MEYTTINMDDSSKGDLFYRSLKEVLISVSRGGLTFFAPPGSDKLPPIQPLDLFYPPESHDIIEMAFCMKNRVNLYINGTKYTVKSGPINVLLPGDIHAERFYRPTMGYQTFWIQIIPENIGFQISCYSPNRGYFLLGKRTDLKLESREALLTLGHHQQLHHDRLKQIQIQCKLMEILFEALPLIRQIPDHQNVHISSSSYLLDQLKHHLDSHFQEEISLPDLGRIFHYSPSHLNMLFRKKFGLPIVKYILRKRIDLARHFLKNADIEIKQVAFRTGFNDPLYFSRVFRRIMGISPLDYQSQMLFKKDIPKSNTSPHE